MSAVSVDGSKLVVAGYMPHMPMDNPYMLNSRRASADWRFDDSAELLIGYEQTPYIYFEKMCVSCAGPSDGPLGDCQLLKV